MQTQTIWIHNTHVYIDKYMQHTYLHTQTHACNIHTSTQHTHACMHACIHVYIYTYSNLWMGAWLMPGCSSKFGADIERSTTTSRAHGDTTSSIPHFSSFQKGTRSNHKQPKWHQNHIWFGSGTTLISMDLHA